MLDRFEQRHHAVASDLVPMEQQALDVDPVGQEEVCDGSDSGICDLIQAQVQPEQRSTVSQPSVAEHGKHGVVDAVLLQRQFLQTLERFRVLSLVQLLSEVEVALLGEPAILGQLQVLEHLVWDPIEDLDEDLVAQLVVVQVEAQQVHSVVDGH